MTEHLCVIDQRRPFERAAVCNSCRQWLDRTLTDIVDLYATLPAHLAPGQHQGQRVSGSREAPLPLRVDPLDLTMPARWAMVHDTFGDQVGMPSVASVLDSWARDWADVRAMGETLPAPTVVELARWLIVRLDDACDEHPAIEEFAAEMRDLLRVLRTATGHTGTLPELKTGVPCRQCERVALFRRQASDYIECGSCGVLLTPQEYERWTQLITAKEHQPWVREVIATQRSKENLAS